MCIISIKAQILWENLPLNTANCDAVMQAMCFKLSSCE